MPNLGTQLDLERCPHCSVDRPNLSMQFEVGTADYRGQKARHWRVYKCSRCGGLVTASAVAPNNTVIEFYPETAGIDESIPEKAKEYLQQALNSLHTPAGALMLAASAVDAMLKAKGYKQASLYTRIDKAAEDHVITEGMAQWAHEVRLDANDQRHADEDAPLPSPEDARSSVDFAMALGQFMFVLPARVQRGLREAKPK
jgi:hypothetical protein